MGAGPFVHLILKKIYQEEGQSCKTEVGRMGIKVVWAQPLAVCGSLNPFLKLLMFVKQDMWSQMVPDGPYIPGKLGLVGQ